MREGAGPLLGVEALEHRGFHGFDAFCNAFVDLAHFAVEGFCVSPLSVSGIFLGGGLVCFRFEFDDFWLGCRLGFCGVEAELFEGRGVDVSRGHDYGSGFSFASFFWWSRWRGGGIGG